jgi:predicted TIM-barrel fold metal-dependent hydrolase
MKKIDMHSHWGTKRGYPLQSAEQLAQQTKTWHSEPQYVSEQQMCDYFRAQHVRAILDLHFPKFMPFEQMRGLHDYGFEVQRSSPDVVIGHWIHIDPRSGAEGVQELRRCIDQAPGFLGFGVSGSGTVPASDSSWIPYYRLCIEAHIPVLIFVGMTGYGAGMPAGSGVLLDDCHPRHLDYVAAKYPELTIVAGRPGWPWQDETNAVLLHKRNVWYEVHGWSPKYFTPALKHEISRRLKERVMFGADYPLFTYERLERDWRAEGYSEDVLEQVFHLNAERFFRSLEKR